MKISGRLIGDRTELGSQYYPLEQNIYMNHVMGDVDGLVSCRVGNIVVPRYNAPRYNADLAITRFFIAL